MLPVTVPYAAPAANGKHLLDVYQPQSGSVHTVVIFIHGGGLTEGDRRWYRAVGASLAQGGYVAVLPSYRYYPAVDPLGSAHDVVEAIAWTARHIARYGGNPSHIVLAGHSAGSWMVDLVMMNQSVWNGTGFSHAPVAAAAYDPGTCNDRDTYARALRGAGIDVTVYTDTGTHMGEVEHLHTRGSKLRTVFDTWVWKIA